jgi:hypothetical protein
VACVLDVLPCPLVTLPLSERKLVLSFHKNASEAYLLCSLIIRRFGEKCSAYMLSTVVSTKLAEPSLTCVVDSVGKLIGFAGLLCIGS